MVEEAIGQLISSVDCFMLVAVILASVCNVITYGRSYIRADYATSDQQHQTRGVSA